jgi:signal peptidase
LSEVTAESRQRPRRWTPRRVSGVVRSVLLNITAAAGAVCIVLVVLALVFHISLVMFRTGSMAPTIPTGSLAVVKRIPADQARVGDVVTVNRPGHQLPITHRVVSVTPGGDGNATLVLKGDANASVDAAPYRVHTVRQVIWHAAGLARVIVWFGRPLVLATLTVLVAALVTWVLWPRREENDEQDEAAEDAAARTGSGAPP